MGKQVITPDGVFGPRTRAAIEEFQRVFGMPLGGDLAEQLNTVSQALRGEMKPQPRPEQPVKRSRPPRVIAASIDADGW